MVTMFLTTLFATATIGAVSGTVCYLISKEDKRKLKETLRAYLNDYQLNYSYNFHDKAFIITPATMEGTTKVKIVEDQSTITCVFYISILRDIVPVYSFKYDKYVSRIYDVKEDYYFGSNKGKEIDDLMEQFTFFILTGEWKSKIDYWEKSKEEHQKPKAKKQTIADPDIQHHLHEIEKKVQWLKDTHSLEIEDEHKIDVLREDTEQVLKAYHSFRDETKMAFKEKVLEALQEIVVKLNEISIKKEEQIISDIDRTITLIKKR